MKYAIVNSNNIIQNIIIYDGESPYTPPEGCTLEQVNNWLQKGDNISAPEPSPSEPTPLEKAAIAVSNGIIITSTGTPALNGTYPLNQITQNKVNGLATYILLNNAFPSGLTEMPWYDISGTAHLFPSVVSFKNFASAFANFVAAVTLYADSNGEIGEIPSNEITIP